MSKKLQNAKIYLSIYNNKDDKEELIDSLKNEKGRLKNELGTRLRKHIRRIPEIDFYLDETLDVVERRNKIIVKFISNYDSMFMMIKDALSHLLIILTMCFL